MARSKQNVRKIGDSKPKSQRRLTDNNNQSSSFLDKKAHRRITGICLVALGVCLFVIAVLPTNSGAVTSFLASAVHLTLGICCYVLPILLIIMGGTFFVDKDDSSSNARLTLGISIVFLGLISLSSMFAPITTLGVDDPSLLFSERYLTMFGGYVGNGAGWLLITLFGKVVSVIICIAIVLIGMVVAGFSREPIKRKFKQIFKKDDRHESNDLSSPQIKLDKNGDIDPSSFAGFEPGPTEIMPGAGKRRLKKPEPRKRELSQTRVITAEELEAAGEEDMGEGQTKQMTRKLSKPSELVAPKVEPLQELGKPDSDFKLPSFDLIAKPVKKSKSKAGEKILEETAGRLQQTLQDFGVPATVVDWIAGPTVTLFEIELPAGVRVNRVQNLGTDLALALATSSVRIFAPIPGTNYVGIEVPNQERETVVLSEVLRDAKPGALQIAIGKDVEGNSIVSDLAKMPHLLIGGTTGSGKSVSVNAMIMSILMRATPDEVRFIMIDPKRVEFTPYNGIPHLYTPVVTEPKEAASALAWGVAEMEHRLKLMSEIAARNITEYNAKVKSGEYDDIAKKDDEGNDIPKHKHLPYIVIIIDELADLMMSVGKEVEMSICRIAQLARAAGIHLIVATQRPSTNVVTGLIKSNITNRIAFNVASSIDSRVILDSTGAEDLIGLGDLLLSKPEFGKPLRIQGCFVSEKEISAVVDFIKEQGEPEYHTEILNTNIMSLGDTSPNPSGGGGEDDDPLVWEAAEIVINSGMGSTSNLQRRLKVGYARAGRIMDQLEEKGVVGSANGSKPREVLVDALELETLKAFEAND